MDFSAFARTVNWKTCAFAGVYIVCKIVAYFVPAVAGGCEIIDTVAVAGGFISAADASRVQNAVQAVDTLLWKNQLNPETLLPVEPIKP